MTVSGLGPPTSRWIDDDGFEWIEGRSDDAIVRGGFEVFPKEITDVLQVLIRQCSTPVSPGSTTTVSGRCPWQQ